MTRSILFTMIVTLGLGASTLRAQEKVLLGKTADGWATQLKTSGDAKLRRSAAFTLGKMGNRATGALPAMKSVYAKEQDVKVREAIVYAMAEISRDSLSIKADPDLESIFVGAIKDSDTYIRRSGAFGLGCLAAKSAVTREALDRALGDPEAIVRQRAAASLGQFGEAGLPSLKKALADSDSLVKRDAADALLQIENPDKVREVLKELLPICRDANSGVRGAALKVLVQIVDPTDKDALATLEESLKDIDIDNRFYAALALSNIGGDRTLAALPVLLEAAKNIEVKRRQLAVLAIRNLGPAAASALPDLVGVLRDDKDAATREYAALALGGIGKAAEAAVPALVEKIKDTSEVRKIRIECAMALSRIGPLPAAVNAIPALLEILGDPKQDTGLRDRIMFALRVHGDKLRTMNGTKDTFVAIMKEPLTAENRMLRYDCAYMLGRIWRADAPDLALDLLHDFLNDTSIKIYLGTTAGVGNVGEGGTGKVTVKDQAKGDGRVMAVEALRYMGAARYSPRLDIMKQLRVLAGDGNPDVELRKKALELVKGTQ